MEPWPTKPLHGYARTGQYVRTIDTIKRGRSITGAEVRGQWSGFDVRHREVLRAQGFRDNSGSDEGESQKAGAEQGHPARSQGKKAVGNEISISHDTPSGL